MTEEYVRQHPYTKLGEDAVKAVGDLSMALDNSYDVENSDKERYRKLEERLRESLADANNLRDRYAELQAMHLSGIDLHNAQRDLGFCREALRVASDDKAALKTKLEGVQRNLADWRVKYDFVKSDKDVWQEKAAEQTKRAEKAEADLGNVLVMLHGAEHRYADLLNRHKNVVEERDQWMKEAANWKYKYEAVHGPDVYKAHPAAAPRTEWQIKYPEPSTQYVEQDKDGNVVYKGYVEQYPVKYTKSTVLAEQTAECRLTVAEQVEGLETRAKNHENWLNAAAKELDNCDLDQVADGIRKFKRMAGVGEQNQKPMKEKKISFM